MGQIELPKNSTPLPGTRTLSHTSTMASMSRLFIFPGEQHAESERPPLYETTYEITNPVSFLSPRQSRCSIDALSVPRVYRLNHRHLFEARVMPVYSNSRVIRVRVPSVRPPTHGSAVSLDSAPPSSHTPFGQKYSGARRVPHHQRWQNSDRSIRVILPDEAVPII